jgi:hypothetical protein
MQDRTVVADVIAGDAEGFGAAYDQYAASLYAHCRSMLPEGEAAEAVLEVFLIAAAKLDGLGDPERLGAWLQAVARNECLRRLGPAGAGAGTGTGTGAGAAGPGKAETAAAGGEFAAATPPDGLRGKVLAACTDNTPAGRARRASAAHRAGAFDLAGFPRAIGPSGPRWWRRLHRHPGLASLAGLLVPLVVAAVVAAMLAAGGGSHRAAAAAVRSGPDVSAPVSSAVPGPTHPTVPARQVTPPANATPSASVSVSAPAAASSPVLPTRRGTAPSPTSASPSPSPSPSSSPALGYLLVAPAQLSLTSKAGTPVSGSFVLTAVNGPVPRYTVQVAGNAGKVSVSPGGGSLPANGIVTVTVTVTSKVALTTHITVAPNGVSVTVVYTPKPKPAPSPTSTAKGEGG